MEGQLRSGGTPVPNDRALVPYGEHGLALTREDRLRLLAIRSGVIIGDPITALVVIVAVVLLAVAAGFAARALAPKVPKPTFGTDEPGGDGFASGSPRYGAFGAIQNTVSGELPLPVIYGHVKYGGNAIYQDRWDTEEIKRLISLCEGEISAITDVRVNDVPVAQLEGCSYDAYVGTATQHVDPRASDYVYGLRNVAYIALTLKVSEQLKGGNPTITSVLDGQLVSTWDGTQWTTGKSFSRNPAAILRDYLISTRYGVGFPVSDIDDDSFGEVADYCDEVIDDNQGGTEARFILDIAIDSKRAHADVLRDILATFGGLLVFYGNKLKLRVEKSDPPVQNFTMDNIVADSFSFEYAPADSSPNRLKVLYIDPNQNYARVYVQAEDTIAQERMSSHQGGDGVVQREIALLGISRSTQASRMAQQYLNLAKFTSIVIKFGAPLVAIHCEPGDVITISHDVTAWVNKPFRIISTSESEDDSVEIVAREHNASAYADRYPHTVVAYQYGSPPNPLAIVGEVTSLTLTEEGVVNTDGDLLSTVLIQWAAPSGVFQLAGYVIQASKDGESPIEVVKLDASAVSHRMPKVAIGSTYTITVRTVSIRDIVSAGVSASIAIVGINSPPANVQNFEVNQIAAGTRLSFTWDQNTDLDLWGYEIREGSGGWDNAAVVASLLLDNHFTLFTFSAGVKTYMIKARDNVGNYSVDPGVDTITVTASPTANVVVSGDEWFYQIGAFDPLLAEWAYTTDVDPLFFRAAVVQKSDKLFDTPVDSDTFDDPALVMDMETGLNTSTITYVTGVFDAGGSVGGLVTMNPTYGNESGGSVSRKLGTSLDGITWTDFRSIAATDVFTGRYYRWLLTVKASSTRASVRLAGFSFSVDVEDVIVQGDNVSIEAGGTTVSIGSGFIFIKSVVANVVGSSARFVVIDEITTSSFKATVFDTSGNSVADTINYIVQGY